MDIEKRTNDLNQEILAYSEYIDNLLGHINELYPKYLPVSAPDDIEVDNSDSQLPKVHDLMNSLRDGVLFGYILYQINPNTIDLSQLNKNIDLSGLDSDKIMPTTPDKAKVVFKVTANHNLILESAKKCGIVVVNIGSEDILQKNVGLVLGLLWQMIRCILLSDINIDSHPELMILLDPDEKINQLSNEQLLLRWVNYHIKYANSSLRISNFSKDISDSEAYITLLERINLAGLLNEEIIELVSKARAFPLTEKEKRAECVLKIANILGCKRFININRIINGHQRLNLSFVATIFNKYPNLNLSEKESMDALKELIRRIRMKDKSQYLSYDEEFKHLKTLLSKNNYLDCNFPILYGDSIENVDWLNELALYDMGDVIKEKKILYEMSEIEKRDKIIEELNKNISECECTNKDLEHQNKEYEIEIDKKYSQITEQKEIIIQQKELIKKMECEIENQRELIKNNDEKMKKQNEEFSVFKSDITNELKTIETLMKKNNSQIIDIDQSQENNGSSSLNPDSDKITDESDPLKMYTKVESYVKRLLEELKKVKEQNYIFKSQIVQNDKINAILNEKIIEYSENACKESIKTSKTNLSGKKKFIPS